MMMMMMMMMKAAPHVPGIIMYRVCTYSIMKSKLLFPGHEKPAAVNRSHNDIMPPQICIAYQVIMEGIYIEYEYKQ